MAYNTLMTQFSFFIKYVDEELKNAVSATENTRANIAAMLANASELNSDQMTLLTSSSTERLTTQGTLKANAAAMFWGSYAPKIAIEIGSSSVNGNSITDREQFFRDWIKYMVTNDEHVTPRAVAYAADPAAQNGGTRLIRMTVDKHNNKIESGRHAETVQVSVSAKPALGKVTLELKNSDGPIDELDYQTADPDEIEIDLLNEITNATRFVTNPFMTGNGSTADNAPITIMTGWELTIIDGAPVFQITSLAAEVFRSRPFGFSIGSAAGSEQQIRRRIPSSALNDKEQPLFPDCPFLLPAGSGWTGNITITWGSMSQVFTQADLIAGTWVNLIPARDSKLYVENFDSTAPYWQLNIETTGGAGDEVVFAGFMVGEFPQSRHGNAYAGISGEDDPAMSDTFTGWIDANTFAGKVQNILGYILDDELPSLGFLKSVGATNRPVDPV